MNKIYDVHHMKSTTRITLTWIIYVLWHKSLKANYFLTSVFSASYIILHTSKTGLMIAKMLWAITSLWVFGHIPTRDSASRLVNNIANRWEPIYNVTCGFIPSLESHFACYSDTNLPRHAYWQKPFQFAVIIYAGFFAHNRTKECIFQGIWYIIWSNHIG